VVEPAPVAHLTETGLLARARPVAAVPDSVSTGAAGGGVTVATGPSSTGG